MPRSKTNKSMDSNAWHRHGEIYFHTRPSKRPLGKLLDWLNDHPLTEVALLGLLGTGLIVLVFVVATL